MLSKLGVFNYVLKRVLFIHIYVVCPADQAALGRVFLERPELLEQYLPLFLLEIPLREAGTFSGLVFASRCQYLGSIVCMPSRV